MANRFWVLSGGTGSWNGTATGKWSTTSGGAPGAAEPTTADDVFFDGNSGSGTVTLNATGFCRSLITTGYTGTFAGSSDLGIGSSTPGGLTIGSGTTWTYSGTISFIGTSSATLTSSGTVLNTLEIEGTGNTVTLNDDLTAGELIIFAGTFFCNGKTVTAGIVAIEGVDARSRALNLGSSMVNFGLLAIANNAGGVSTIVPGTSQVTINSDGGGLISEDGTAFTLNRLILGSTTNINGGVLVTDQTGTLSITVNDYLSLTGYVSMQGSGGLTAINLTGSLHLGGTPALNITSDNSVSIPFNVSSTITTGNSTLADINATGSSTPWNFAASGATITDGGNNSGITFPLGLPTGVATGVATVSGASITARLSIGSSTGAGVATGIGGGGATSIGTAMGTATAAAISRKLAASIGTSLGASTVAGVTNVIIASTGTAIGLVLVNGKGNITELSPNLFPTEYALDILLPPVEYTA